MAPTGAALDLQARRPRAIAVGGSFGAIDVMRELLPALTSLLAPTFVVLHVAASARNLPALFPGQTVREAEDKELAVAGCVYLAPADYHLLVDAAGRISLSTDAPVLCSRPSIDVLFEAAAWSYRERLLGVLLSGASSDGAAGLASIARHGGLCWAQSPDTAVASTMPRAGIQAVPAAWVLTPGEMLAALRYCGVSRDHAG